MDPRPVLNPLQKIKASNLCWTVPPLVQWLRSPGSVNLTWSSKFLQQCVTKVRLCYLHVADRMKTDSEFGFIWGQMSRTAGLCSQLFVVDIFVLPIHIILFSHQFLSEQKRVYVCLLVRWLLRERNVPASQWQCCSSHVHNIHIN
jgi:hypothetical protein